MGTLRWLIGGILFSLPSSAIAQTHGTGLVDDDPAEIQATPEGDAPVRGVVPPRFDLSESFPRPGDQGSLGTCVGWALSNLESFHEYEARAVSLPEQGPAFSPLFLYALARGPNDLDCSGGLPVLRALRVLRDQGVASIGLMPYGEDRCNVAPDAAALRDARDHRITTFAKVNEHDASELKSYLAARQPVVVSLRSNDGLQHLGRANYTGPSGPPNGGHAVVLVGYDDDRHAWKILNSWGPTWGDRGYGWIDYAAWDGLVSHAYVTERAADRPPAPPPDPAPIPPPSPSPPAPTPDPSPVMDRSTLDDDLRLGLESHELAAAFHDYRPDVRPSLIESYVSGGAVRFNAVFHRGSLGYAWNWNDTSATFSARAADRQRDGLFVAGMQVVELSDGPRFLTWWSRAPGTTWSTNFQLDGFSALYSERRERGWQPRSLSATASNGRRYFHVVWQSRRGEPDVLPSWFDRSETFAATAARLRASGYETTQLVPLVDGARTYFHALWRRQREQTTWSLFDNARSFASTGEAFAARGFTPISIGVTVQNNTPYFHSLWRRGGSCGWNWNLDADGLRAFDARQRAHGRHITWLRTYSGEAWVRYVAVACQS